jgi:hypothetical protein
MIDIDKVRRVMPSHIVGDVVGVSPFKGLGESLLEEAYAEEKRINEVFKRRFEQDLSKDSGFCWYTVKNGRWYPISKKRLAEINKL